MTHIPNPLIPNPRAIAIEHEWATKQMEIPRESTHLCATCKTPFGKSAVRCPKEPKGATRG